MLDDWANMLILHIVTTIYDLWFDGNKFIGYKKNCKIVKFNWI